YTEVSRFANPTFATCKAATETDSDDDRENIDLNAITNTNHTSKETIDNLDSRYFKSEGQPLKVTRRNGKFACGCGFYVIRGHLCQDTVAVEMFLGNSIYCLSLVYFLTDSYRCTGNVTCVRHISPRLPPILVINATGIAILDDGTRLTTQDLPEEFG